MAYIDESALNDFLDGEDIASAVEEIATDIRDRARAIAPVDSGNYKRNLIVERRADGESDVIADVEYAGYVEADHGVLARASHLTRR